ncbi:MAG: type II toxin-antitoxin system RelE/ParE family toxin [Leptolyngbya sp. SIO4C1]|nr:type II toxin-antitoxin system RelE/ParE family toxin [Leptolyngbya sp. SIO4C1]
MADVRFTLPFKRRLKSLAKRYRQIQKDIQPIIDELQKGNFIGDRITGTSITAFKVRAKNSDIPTGKSGGYRLIYQVHSPDSVSLLLIYAKSDQADVTIQELEDAIQKALEE